MTLTIEHIGGRIASGLTSALTFYGLFGLFYSDWSGHGVGLAFGIGWAAYGWGRAEGDHA